MEQLVGCHGDLRVFFHQHFLSFLVILLTLKLASTCCTVIYVERGLASQLCLPHVHSHVTYKGIRDSFLLQVDVHSCGYTEDMYTYELSIPCLLTGFRTVMPTKTVLK